MKSVVLKDLYNMRGNGKSVLISFLILAVAMASTGVGVLYSGAILCSSLIVSTFAYDDRCDWAKYAVVMPISRNELVAGKYAMLQELLISTLAALVFALVYGSIAIPLILRFGAEQGRVLLLVALLVPAAVCFAVYQVGKWMGIVLTDQGVVLLVCGAAVAALVWMAVSYRISCGIFAKQEL